MAPEVARKRECYNESCDVFSFGMMLWEMLSLDTRFGGLLDSNDYYYRIVLAGERPPLSQSWPASVRELLQKAWSAQASERPSFTEIRAILKEHCQ